jgi:hypothetical protein
MKRYVFILMFFVFASSKSFSQSLRKCGCQTWREWKAANPNNSKESRWARISRYEKYKHNCIIACRQREMQKRR